MIKIGPDNIKIMLGNSEIPAIYCGDTLIYPMSESGLSVSPSGYTFEATGGTFTITVESDLEWYVEAKPNWITLSTLSGNTGTTYVTATANANTGSSQLSSHIAFTSSDDSVTEIVDVKQKASSSHSLPDVTYILNINAKDADVYSFKPGGHNKYVESRMKTNYIQTGYSTADGIYFRTSGGTNTSESTVKPVLGNGYVTIGNRINSVLRYSSTSNNPFNRTSAQNTFTFVFKCRQTNNVRLLANRGDGSWAGNSASGTYNYMIGASSVGMTAFMTAERDVVIPANTTGSANPGAEIFSITFSGGTGNGYNWTQNLPATTTASGKSYRNASGRFCFFGGGTGTEYWTGDFYWLYVSDKVLTNEQIQQVIDFNEN